MEMEMEMKMEMESIIDSMIEDALFHVLYYNHRDYDREHNCWYDEFAIYDYQTEEQQQEQEQNNDIHDNNYDLYNEIYDEILDSNDFDCIPKKYYIGCYCEYTDEKEKDILEVKTIKNTTFYKLTNEEISKFIDIIYYFNKPVHIMQIITNEDGTYKHVILKTYWIIVIQRKWKKRMLQKKEYDKKIKKQICSFSNTYQVTSRKNHSYNGLNGLI
jgi:hypothetical protein